MGLSTLPSAQEFSQMSPEDMIGVIGNIEQIDPEKPDLVVRAFSQSDSRVAHAMALQIQQITNHTNWHNTHFMARAARYLMESGLEHTLAEAVMLDLLRKSINDDPKRPGYILVVNRVHALQLTGYGLKKTDTNTTESSTLLKSTLELAADAYRLDLLHIDELHEIARKAEAIGKRNTEAEFVVRYFFHDVNGDLDEAEGEMRVRPLWEHKPAPTLP